MGIKKDRHWHAAQLGGFLIDPGAPVLLGTDGSYRHEDGSFHQRPVCWGYVAENGCYGLGAAVMPYRVVTSRVLQTELRAIWWALQVILPDHPVRVLSDSTDALRMIERWRQGSEEMPPGYSPERVHGRKSTMLRLAHLVAEHADRISVQKVRGHTGHPLNEGADALAKIARIWATRRISKETAHSDAGLVARSRLDAYWRDRSPAS